MLYLPAFSESNAWDFHLVMTDISGNVPATSEDFRRISEDFRTLPKIKCLQMFQKTFEHFRSYLKDDTFSALWHDFVRTQKRTQSHHVLRIICSDLWVRREKLSLIRDIDVFSPQAKDSRITCIQYSDGIIVISLMVYNFGLWPAKTFEWRRVTQDLRKGGPLEILTIAKLIKSKVLWHQFSNLKFNLHYMWLLRQL